MVFIPNKFYIFSGCRVRILKDMIFAHGTFTKGHEFKVISMESKEWKLQDDDGRVIYVPLSTNLERVDVMTQSPELTQFYREYNAWLEEGAPDFTPFFRGCGLCFNAQRWGGRNLENELTLQLRHLMYPFNENKRDYFREASSSTCHLNPKRIKWVKDHI